MNCTNNFSALKITLNKTMVLVTHDMSEAFRLGDRITVLKDGRIHQMGTPQELIDTPATPYVTSLVQHLFLIASLTCQIFIFT